MVRIIVVHGRGTKPPYPCKLRLVREVLTESVRRVDPKVGRWLSAHPDTIQLTYYADLVRRLTGDQPEECRSYREPIRRLYQDSRGISGWLAWRARLRDLGIDVAASLLRFASFEFRARLLRHDFEDVQAYLHDQAFASAVRARLEALLLPVLARGERVLLLAHSLGSVIAYEALWELSHSPAFAPLRSATIERFVTLGSPLGDEPLRRRLLGWRRGGVVRFPTTIRRWDNLAARGDAVAHDARLSNDFRPMIRQGLIERLVDRTGLCTVYRSRDGTWNPHKLYGYLLLPELGRLVAEHLSSG